MQSSAMQCSVFRYTKLLPPSTGLQRKQVSLKLESDFINQIPEDKKILKLLHTQKSFCLKVFCDQLHPPMNSNIPISFTVPSTDNCKIFTTKCLTKMPPLI